MKPVREAVANCLNDIARLPLSSSPSKASFMDSLKKKSKKPSALSNSHRDSPSKAINRPKSGKSKEIPHTIYVAPDRSHAASNVPNGDSVVESTFDESPEESIQSSAPSLPATKEPFKPTNPSSSQSDVRKSISSEFTKNRVSSPAPTETRSTPSKTPMKNGMQVDDIASRPSYGNQQKDPTLTKTPSSASFKPPSNTSTDDKGKFQKNMNNHNRTPYEISVRASCILEDVLTYTGHRLRVNGRGSVRRRIIDQR